MLVKILFTVLIIAACCLSMKASTDAFLHVPTTVIAAASSKSFLTIRLYIRKGTVYWVQALPL